MNNFQRPAWLGKDSIAPWIFLAPSAAGFILFYIIPFGMGIVYSFTDATVGGAFVGFGNYAALLNSRSFHKASMNTLLFTGISVPLLILLSLMLALLLNRQRWTRSWLQTSFILPLVVPVASITMIWQIFMDWNGALNAWMHSHSWGRIDWMQSDWSIGVVVVLYIWKNIGYDMILFLAGLQAIPVSYYESARMDGASKLRQFVHITRVYLTPTMIFVVLISIINSFKVFRETYLLAGDYPYDRIYMVQHYMNNMFFSLDIQKLTAGATLMVGCILILVFILLAIERRFQSFME
ncbi:carbohydrate ABC transporter permease [Paenibacillus planticolens]|uniref:ABC transporter permease subunit n=1 Tax=Paenibacillus planticolens TaxID=2654976 RepID=A0ABX1ZTJ8_9BACL|nr:sugar ABC transporter permease [Paenibacillus planticolens]NOV02257.1 ABC transporter permease subunit [Paenibacillus planticolens]